MSTPSWLPFTDYRIKSTRILGGTIIGSFLITLLLFASELIVDLRTTTPFLLLPFLALNTILLIAYFLGSNARYLSIAWGLVQILTVEVHFAYNPTSLHVMNFWLVLIPLGTIIIGGVRQAFGWLVISCVAIIANALYTIHEVGESYTLTIQVTPFIYSGLIFLIAVIAASFLLYNMLGNAYEKMKSKSHDLEVLHLTTEKKKVQLENYQSILFRLSKESAITSGNIDAAYEKICKTTVESLQVSRVSIWTFQKDPVGIVRRFLFEEGSGTDERVFLDKKDFPRYFESMETKSFIAATHAQTNPETSEFTETYLKPYNIFSMLDSPISTDGEFMGVICCEHQNEVKQWTPEDILFVQSLADILAIAFKANQINRLLKQIRNQNHELFEKNNEIDTLNEELMATNEELTTINDSLEVAVQERTKKLEQQNTQLTEYAFINSHLLRAPLSRIQGLANIIAYQKNQIPDLNLLEALTASTSELDTITRKISELLYDGRNFSREEINEIINRNFNKPE